MSQSVPPLSKKTDDCSHCSVKLFCLPQGLNDLNIDKLEHLVKHKQVLHKNELLFEAGQTLSKLYVVRSGSFKTYKQLKNEQIINFHLPGEVLGFDALANEQHTLSACALETSSVCEISFKDLFALAAQMPLLQKRLLILACQQEEKHHLFSLNSSAIERLASLIINLSGRFKRHGLSANDFYLSMTRQDIANYLGLTNETTSRMFTQLTKEKIIKLENRHIEIINRKQLEAYVLNN